MEDLDKMMACLGFNDQSVKDFAATIPFKSRQSDIMGKLKNAGELASYANDFYALFYILSIAFSVLVIRFFVLIEANNTVLVTFLTGLVIDHSDQLMNGFKLLSLLFSGFICIGVYSLIHYFKNEQKFC